MGYILGFLIRICFSVSVNCDSTRNFFVIQNIDPFIIDLSGGNSNFTCILPNANYDSVQVDPNVFDESSYQFKRIDEFVSQCLLKW